MFSRPSSGFSTVECLVALMLFALGILGSAGTMAMAIRTVHAGAAAAAAARLVISLKDSLAAVIQEGGSCAPLGAGTASGPYAVEAAWRTSPAVGGSEIELTVTRPALRGPVVDTIVSFVACR
jgi:hypothetical protein